jgi:hypothetical protein
MVDATDLKSVVRKGVRVRVPPSAPCYDYYPAHYLNGAFAIAALANIYALDTNIADIADRSVQ